MGKEADGTGERIELFPGHLREVEWNWKDEPKVGVSWETFDQYIMETYKTGPQSELLFLYEKLEGFCFRDQWTRDPEENKKHRKALQSSLATIKEEAKESARALASLEASFTRFGLKMSATWSAPMLYEIFDIAYPDIDTMNLPIELNALSVLYDRGS